MVRHEEFGDEEEVNFIGHTTIRGRLVNRRMGVGEFACTRSGLLLGGTPAALHDGRRRAHAAHPHTGAEGMHNNAFFHVEKDYVRWVPKTSPCTGRM